MGVSDDTHKYEADLRITSPTITARDLTGRFGEPTSSYEIGDPVSLHLLNSPLRKLAVWTLGSGVDSGRTLDLHIPVLLDFVESRQVDFDAVRSDCFIDIFCAIFTGDDAQGGFPLEPALSRRLAELELTVTFDVY